MIFLLGLLTGLFIHSENSHLPVGGIWFMTMEEVEAHLKNPPPNPFELQDASRLEEPDEKMAL